MSNPVIRVENLSKQYRLGQIGTGTISHDLNRWWHRIRGKEDPYLKIGETNDRASQGNSEYVWALQDINFEVKQGEVLGIIGKNGAGKSTLLKILSKVTGPTTGSIKAKGRIASLLEVGTGFHPELSGRENIFLNGTILGMSKAEVKKKLEEIVEFAGVARYLDTPVKRYSSGMMVRLGFAVAAHLEPEILIVDEVLAVGDAEFQKKAIGKMQDVSRGEGRTVLFVSHNMTSIRSLCSRAILLNHGTIRYRGDVSQTIRLYLEENENLQVTENNKLGEITKKSDYNSGEGRFTYLMLKNELGDPADKFFFLEKILVDIHFEAYRDVPKSSFALQIEDKYGTTIFIASPGQFYENIDIEKGVIKLEVTLNTKLMPGIYSAGLLASHYVSGNTIDSQKSITSFEVLTNVRNSGLTYPWNTIHGYVKPEATFKIIQE